MARKSSHSDGRHKSMTFTRFSVAPSLVLIGAFGLSACDRPDPADYGGGMAGEAIAKCVTRTERAESRITREQAEDMCACLNDRVANTFATGREVSKQAMLQCAVDAGIPID